MNRTQQEIEALADIFVGDVPTPQHPLRDRVVLLVEGHLPVRGALWRQAAAQLVAGESRAAAAGGLPEATCGGVSGGAGTLLEIDDRQLHAVQFGGGPLQASTLEHIIGAPAAGHLWMVAGFGGMLGPDAGALVNEIVLVTGADQAAVVGAYRAVKQLVSERAGDPLTVGVIIAGSSPAVSEEVWGRLSSTFSEHLNVTARLVGILSRLDVAEPANRLSVPMPAEGLSHLLSTIRARPVGLAASPAAAASTLTPTPQPVEARSTPPASSERLPEGLRPFTVPTPVPTGVRVAVDADGGVHLVAEESQCGALESARNWARQHLPLLAAADSGIRAEQPVSCDLLVEDYHRAGSLAGGPWKVYLVHASGCLPVPPPESPLQSP